MLPGKKSTVLLVEADVSLRRLITLGLQQHNIHVIEASSPTSVASLDIPELDMLVLDIDAGGRSDWSLIDAAQQYPHFTDVPTVVLSWECLIPVHLHAAPLSAMTTAGQMTCLTKPFDARVLHTTIEQLLAIRAAREADAIVKAEEVLLASYSVQTAPSIWPIITAAGVLLVFIGIMLQIAVTVAGILIVMIALLLWTLGTKPGVMHPCEG
jgi:DNA-binding response OmpR family regulator